MLTLSLLTPPGQPTVNVVLEVVSSDIPTVLCMDVLDKESFRPCTIIIRLVKGITDEDSPLGHTDVWNLPVKRIKSGHLYASMEYNTPIYNKY